MRHRKRVAKLNRDHSHRKSMLANMVTSLFAHESINTTVARARELRRTAEHMITFAKRGDVHARRRVLRLIPDKAVVSKLFEELGPRYADRGGGYTRIVKTEARRGDGATMCLIELVDRPGAAGAAKPAVHRDRDAATSEEPATESATESEDKEENAG